MSEDRRVMHTVMEDWMAGTAGAILPQVVYEMLIVLENRGEDEFSIQEGVQTINAFVQEMRGIQQQGVEALPLKGMAVWLAGKESSLPFTGVSWLMTLLRLRFRDEFSREKALDSLSRFIAWAEDIKTSLLRGKMA